MRYFHPPLLVGPCDWHEEILSRNEFADRISALHALAGDDVDLLVHGDRLDDAALRYLSHFVPKLGPAFAWLPRQGRARLFYSGGAGMAASVRRLSWIEEVQALGRPRHDLHELLHAPGRTSRLGVVGGAGMSRALRADLLAALPPGMPMLDLDDALNRLRRRKSAAELALLRRSGAILQRALDTLCRAPGALPAALVEAERTAYENGAQELRSTVGRASLRLAVCHGGYWTAAAVALPAADARTSEAAVIGCRRILDAMRPGLAVRSLHEHLPAGWGLSLTVTGLGLSQDELPFLTGEQRLAEGDACLVTVCIDGTDVALASVPVLIGPSAAMPLCAIAQPMQVKHE